MTSFSSSTGDSNKKKEKKSLKVDHTYLSLHHEVPLKPHLTDKTKHVNAILLAYSL